MVAETDQNRLFLMKDSEAEPIRLPQPGSPAVEWTALSNGPGLFFYALDGPGRAVHQYDYQGNYLGQALDLNRVARDQDLVEVEPGGLAVTRTGHGMVTDRLGDRLLVFGPGWSFLGVWGQSGSEPGSWRRPGRVAVGESGDFVIADEGNDRVVVVDSFGNLVSVRDLDDTPRGVAVMKHGFAVSLEDRVEFLGSTLGSLRSFHLVRNSSCFGHPYATTALATGPRFLLVGEGCSGRLMKIDLGGG